MGNHGKPWETIHFFGWVGAARILRCWWEWTQALTFHRTELLSVHRVHRVVSPVQSLAVPFRVNEATRSTGVSQSWFEVRFVHIYSIFIISIWQPAILNVFEWFDIIYVKDLVTPTFMRIDHSLCWFGGKETFEKHPAQSDWFLSARDKKQRDCW